MSDEHSDVWCQPEHRLVGLALTDLVKREERWRPNFVMWGRMSNRYRYRWWEQVKAQGEQGLPMAHQLIQAVIVQRLKS